MKKIIFFILLTPSLACAFSFTTPVPLSSTQTNNLLPQVVIDVNGNATAIWVKNLVNQIEVARFNFATSQWSTPQIIGSGNFPQLSVDLSGNIIAVWLNMNNQQIQAARYNNSIRQWSIPVQISNGGINSFPQVSVNNKGNAVAVWMNFPTRVFASSFNAATFTWSTPVQFSPNGGDPQVKLNNFGTGIAVWENFSTGAIDATIVSVP